MVRPMALMHHCPRHPGSKTGEKQAIITYALAHPDQGYRRLAYQMIDEDVVAVSPSSVYRVLKGPICLVEL